MTSYPHPRDNPYQLLSCHRIHNSCQHQPGHRDKQGPEYFLHLLNLPECIDKCNGPYIRQVAQRPE